MTGSTIQVTVNGEAHVIAEGTILLDLLETLGEPYAVAVVELNHKFVYRQTFAQTMLQDGDDVEVMLIAFGG